TFAFHLAHKFVMQMTLSFKMFFFFQAEDGIRDFHVTGVQTCALPICPMPLSVPAPSPAPYSFRPRLSRGPSLLSARVFLPNCYKPLPVGAGLIYRAWPQRRK